MHMHLVAIGLLMLPVFKNPAMLNTEMSGFLMASLSQDILVESRIGRPLEPCCQNLMKRILFPLMSEVLVK